MPANGDEDVSTGTQTEDEEVVLGLQHLNGHSASNGQADGEPSGNNDC